MLCERQIDMKTIWMMLAGGAMGMMAGCAGDSFLEQRTNADRAVYGSDLIAVPPARVETVNPNPIGPGGVLIVEKVAGSWKFTTPETVTRVEKKTAEMDQFSLYNGVPQPTDLPFLVIQTTRNRASIAEADKGMYKVSNQREYVMNGAIAQEWTGLTSNGAGFCELVVRKPGTEGQTGDVCHAMAIVKTEDERKLALGILESIAWEANRP